MDNKRCISLLIIAMIILGVALFQFQNSSAISYAPGWVERIPRDAPQARHAHVIAFDNKRGLTVMFGGLSGGAVSFYETWEYDGTDWIEQTPTVSPPSRWGAAIAYDSIRGEIVLFGGCSFAGYLNDTWIWDGTNWTLKNPNNSPPKRCYSSMTFDSKRGFNVLFGGESSGGYLNDTWEWDGINWVQRNPTTIPLARSLGAMAFDDITNQTILFGGSLSPLGPVNNDTWIWDGVDWTKLVSTPSPSPRLGSSMIYDSGQERIVLFGGLLDNDHFFADIWELDVSGGVWIERITTIEPDERYIAAMAYDSWRNTTVLFGGRERSGKSFKDTWEWGGSLGIWTNTIIPANPPAIGEATAMIYDSIRGELVLFGGAVVYCGPISIDETWTLDSIANQWSRQKPSNNPTARSNHMMTFDSSRGLGVLFGGVPASYDPTPSINDTWEWDGTNWHQLHPVNSPSPRYDSGMIYDPIRGVTLLFGGRDWSSNPLLGDTWTWDGVNWTQLFPPHSPSPRCCTRIAFDSARGVAVLYGGYDTNGPNAETWEWDGSDWQKRTPVNSPPRLAFHGLAYDKLKDKTILFSGQQPVIGGFVRETWEWDGTNWTQQIFSTNPLARSGHAMAYDSIRGSVIIFGGESGVGKLDDTWEYRSPTPVNVSPEIFSDSTSVITDEGQTATNSGTYSDSNYDDNVTISSAIGFLSKTGTSSGTWSWSYPTTNSPGQSQSITITADDSNGGTAQVTFQLTVNNVEPSIDSITVPLAPVDINDQPISASAIFSDPAGINDEPYTCTVDYGNGDGAQVGMVSGTTCTGPDQIYTEPGIYQITVTVTDKDGGTGSATASEFIVIYDPSGGFVTGGGWIWSPAGAFMADPELYGKANFGFVSKYKKGADTPTGNTEFQFRAAGLNFHSNTYDWLVVNQGGTNAQLKGVGTINGAGEYKFMLWAGDGEPDTFRIMIWTEDDDANEAVYYDNGFDQAIGGGNIVIHTKNK